MITVQEQVMIHSIHHIAIISSSEASIVFYEKLGFSEYKRISRNYDTVVLMNGPGFELEIFIDPNHKYKTEEPYGLRHLALKVGNIEATVEELSLECDPIGTDWNGVRYAYIHDPDGLTIELHE